MSIELTPEADTDLSRLVAATGMTGDALASHAVQHLHRTLIGLPDTHPHSPKIDTGPFRKRYSYQPAEIVLRQIDATEFKLEEPFRFIGDDGTAQWIVPDRDVSDLASVPSFLTWLVPRYGRHTLAALLHDHLQDPHIDNPVSSARADEVFRDSMGDLGVPLILRWVMWAAVSARTRKNAGGFSMLTVIAWLAVYTVVACVGLPALAFGAAAGWWTAGTAGAVGACVLASPFVLGLVWLRGYRFAVLSGSAVLVIGWAALLDVVVYGVYAAVETASRVVQRHPKPIRVTRLEAEQADAVT